jgi:uncharacterized membrane protein YfcA
MDSILLYVVAGFLAQMIDGSLGMGYKVSSTTFLLSIGLPPVLASASVHTAGVVTSAVSGFSHYKFGNFNRDLIWRLAVPGVIGGVIGAILLTNLPTDIIKPIVGLYLTLMGVRIILKALSRSTTVQVPVNITILGLFGGFFDAIGGGGWGPIVTSTLVVNGHEPRFVIGSVNIAEWFVTIIQATTFILAIGESYRWEIIGGLMLGGVIGAPIAAWLCQRIPTQRLMLLVGILIVILSLRTLALAFFPV